MLAFFTWNSNHEWFRLDEFTSNYGSVIQDKQLIELCEATLNVRAMASPVSVDGKEAGKLIAVLIPGEPTVPSGFSLL
jgi:hypothetical protein